LPGETCPGLEGTASFASKTTGKNAIRSMEENTLEEEKVNRGSVNVIDYVLAGFSALIYLGDFDFPSKCRLVTRLPLLTTRLVPKSFEL
jgi:hypothetical protein